MTEAMRVQKYLSRAGVASRREAEGLMLQGRVRVNGAVCTELGTRVDPTVDRVELDGLPVALEAPRWVVFHKPRGVLTTRTDPRGRPTVYDHVPPSMASLKYLGRLDMDTSGLLLLSNRGDRMHRLLHPSFEIEREYEADVAGRPTEAVLARLRTGVELDDGPARVASVDRRGRWRGGDVLGLVLTEGRNREVRRLCEAVRHPARRLRRIRFGPIRLGDLAPGSWRDLNDDEIAALEGAVPHDDDA